MNETRRKRVLHKQKNRGFLQVGIIGLGLTPCLAVTEETLFICILCLGLALIIAWLIRFIQ